MAIDLKTIDDLPPIVPNKTTRLVGSKAGATGRFDLTLVEQLLIAPVLADMSGEIVTGGVGNVYTVVSARNPVALLDGFSITFRANRDSSGPGSLDMAPFGPRVLQKEGGVQINQGDIKDGCIYRATYVAAADAYRLTSGSTAINTLLGPNVPADRDTLSELAAALAASHSSLRSVHVVTAADNLEHTNMILRSQELDNASWTKSAVTVTANAAVAPNGTTTADKVVETVTSASHYIQTAGGSSLPAGTATFSVYAKAGERSTSQIYLVDGTGIISGSLTVFNLAIGTIISGTNGTIQKLADGWYRLSVTVPTVGGVYARIFIGTSSYAGDGTSGAYYWGAQLEIGSSPSAYIPTTTVGITAKTYAVTDAERGSLITFDRADDIIVSPDQSPSGTYCLIRNTNAGAVNITPATSTINGDATLALAAGDASLIVSYGANYIAIVWRAVQAAPAAHGQVELSKVGGNIVLSPKNGNRLIVNGAVCTVPSAGVSLAATGLTAGTLHYIYATAAAGVVTALEASATAWAEQTGTGIKVKTGDATRTLVGMAQPIAGPAWADTETQRFVRSYFNRPGISLVNGLPSSAVRSASSFGELDAANGRIEALLWASEVWQIMVSGSVSNNTLAEAIYTSIGIDGVSAQPAVSLLTQPVAGYAQPLFVPLNAAGLSEGYHYATILGRVGGGTGTWAGNASATLRCNITGTVIRAN